MSESGSAREDEEDRESKLAVVYERARPRLNAVAYAILGTFVEAEDVVSECWLRLVAADAREHVGDVDAWATVTVARAALDVLRSARKRRETYPGPWLPEPLVEFDASTGDPADRVTLDEQIGYALLVVLETLTPAERTAWVLHDLFGMEFEEVAATVGRTPAAVRQLASRARKHVNERAPRVDVLPGEHEVAVQTFLQASLGGDLNAMLAALDPDVVLVSDGGGKVRAAIRPVVGADRVARFLLGLAAKSEATQSVRSITLNGEPGVGVFTGDLLTTAISLTFKDGRVSRINMVRSPEKLRH